MQGVSSDLSNSANNANNAAHTGNHNLGKLLILYYNARSVLPKLDNLAATCPACSPDIVCMVESWLCSDTSDNEISLPNYSIIRLDRNCHGGGILLYFKDNLSFKVVLHGPSGLELIFISILLPNSRSICLGTFYRPPSSSVAIFDSLFDVLCSLNSNSFSNFILFGDFNVDMSSHFFNCNYMHLTNLLHSFSLTQVVDEPTRPGHNGASSLIDLVLMSTPQALRECVTVPPLANSDHLGIRLQVESYSNTLQTCPKRRVIWRYEFADINRVCELLSNLDLDWIFSDAQIDECWSRWKKAFLDIMDTCIPKSTLPDRRSVPWMTKEIVQAIRRRNYFYRKAKRSNSGNYHSKYKNLRSRVITMLRQSKHNFFKNLNPNSNKAFWKAVRCLNKKTSSIPTLTTSASTATTDREKAELLNAHFSSCFNSSLPPIAADYASMPISSEFPEGLRCTEDEVRKLLSTIDPSKASGPDCISARMLK